MKSATWTTAWLQLLLVAPAALFFAALFLRDVQPLIGTAEVVSWYARHPPVGLDVCLVCMPLAALCTGAALLYRRWRRDEVFQRNTRRLVELTLTLGAPLLIALATLLAGAVLLVVALHLATE